MHRSTHQTFAVNLGKDALVEVLRERLKVVEALAVDTSPERKLFSRISVRTSLDINTFCAAGRRY